MRFNTENDFSDSLLESWNAGDKQCTNSKYSNHFTIQFNTLSEQTVVSWNLSYSNDLEKKSFLQFYSWYKVLQFY